MSQIKVLLVDDHPVVRAGIRGLLEEAEDILVVGEASDGEQALQAITQLNPDVIVLDIEMRGMDGIAVAQALKTQPGAPRILVLSVHQDKRYVLGLLEQGAAGYLTKDEAMDTIIEAIRGIASGQTGWLSRTVAAKVVAWTVNKPSEYDQLTEREIEVLRLLAKGLDNQAISAALHISEKTVKNHVSTIYSKLNVTTRIEAGIWAWRHGLGGQDT